MLNQKSDCFGELQHQGSMEVLASLTALPGGLLAPPALQAGR